MALSKLSDDTQRAIFRQLCNLHDPSVTQSSPWPSAAPVSSELRALTQAERQLGARILGLLTACVLTGVSS